MLQSFWSILIRWKSLIHQSDVHTVTRHQRDQIRQNKILNLLRQKMLYAKFSLL